MACCLLIKWNCFFMLGGMALVVAAFSIKRREPCNILWGLAGIGVLVLPFVVYFLCLGNFTDFVNEYFINTFSITHSYPLMSFFRDKVLLTFLFVLIALFCRRMRLGYWLLLAFLPFYVFLVLRSVCLHYFASAMPFFVFVLIYVAKVFSKFADRIGRRKYAILLACIFFAGIVFNLRLNYFTAFSRSDGMRVATMQYFAHTDKAKVMFFSGDYGLGLLGRVLPACRYWAQQKDASDQMMREREKAIVARQADFIIISNHSETPANIIPLIKKSGYRQCYGQVTENGTTEVKPLSIFKK